MSENLTSKNLMEGLTALFNKLGYDVKVITNTPKAEEPEPDYPYPWHPTNPVKTDPKTSELLERLSAKFSQLSAEIDNRVAEWHKEIDDLKDQVYQLWNIAKIAEKEQEKEQEPEMPEASKLGKAEPDKAKTVENTLEEDLVNLVFSLFK